MVLIRLLQREDDKASRLIDSVTGKALRPILLRYGTSLLVAALAVTAKGAIDGIVGVHFPFSMLWLPLLPISWLAGLGPGLAAAVLIVACAQYLPLLPEVDPLTMLSRAGRQEVFLACAGLICWAVDSRRRGLERIRQAEAFYHAVAENIPQLVWISDPTGATIYQNRRLHEYFGVDPERTSGKCLADLVHPEDRAGCLAKWEASVRMGSPYCCQYRLLGTDGNYRWFLTRGVPLRKPDGRITHWFATATDIDAEKRAEDAMAHLAAVTASTSVAVISLATDGVITGWNRGAEQMYGYGVAEVMGRSVLDFVPPNRVAETRALLEQVRNGKDVSIEAHRLRKDQSPFLVSLTLAPIRDPQGQVHSISAIGIDITAKAAAEEQLLRSEQEFRAMFELSAVGLGQADPATHRFTRVNQRFCEITGYSEAELLTMTFEQLTHPDDLRQDVERFENVCAGQRSHWFSEKRYVRKDGTVICVEVNGTLIRGPDGKPWRTIAVIEDVTARRLAVKALQESEQRFRNVADTAPVMIWMCDSQGGTIFCNRTCAVFLGRAPETLLSRHWAEFVEPVDQPMYREALSSALASQRAYSVEYRLRRGDGRQRWVVESAVPRLGPAGEFEGFLGTCVDITERKWAQQALQGAFDELEQQIADSQRELHDAESALHSEKKRRRDAEAVLQKWGLS